MSYALEDVYSLLEDTNMKLPLTFALVAILLGGCVVVPIAPPGAYVGRRAVVAAPVVVIRPYYYGRWRWY